MSSLTTSTAWIDLKAHHDETKIIHLRDSFNADSSRYTKFSLRFNDIIFDYSKNRITDQTLPLLINLAKHAGLDKRINEMFSGKKINNTEHRSVLHTALRNRSNQPVYVDGQNVMPQINSVLAKMRTFSACVRSGEWRGYTGKVILSPISTKPILLQP